MGEVTPQANLRSENATEILLVVWCKIIEGRNWILVYCRVGRYLGPDGVKYDPLAT